MKIKNTKYNIGDKFYTLSDNTIKETSICHIQIDISPSVDDNSKIDYEVSYHFTITPTNNWERYSETDVPKIFFKTKKELINSL